MDAWYIDDLELGGKARTRCPTLTSDASEPERDALSIFPVLSIVPAMRIHVCTGRTEAVLNVKVSAAA